MPEISQQEYDSLAQFRKALRVFLRAVENSALAEGLRPQQHQLLLGVKASLHEKGATVGEIADFLQIKHQAAVGLADRCQKAGLIVRSPDPADRRVVRLTLTRKGEILLGNITRRNLGEIKRIAKITEVLEVFSPEREATQSV